MAAPRRVLITGGAGFVGPHLVASIARDLAPEAIVFTGLAPMDIPGATYRPMELTDPASIAAICEEVAPTDCVHMAGISQPRAAASDPTTAWKVNLLGTIALLDVLKRVAPACRLLHVSSADIYGASAVADAPLNEDAVLAPVSVYAATKAAADLAVGQAAAEGLRAVRVRPFNHTGAGQTEAFVTAAIAAQVARAEAGLAPPVIQVGATDRERDFLDVRDVADAYARLIGAFDTLPSGAVFNIASGRARRIGEILDGMVAMARRPLEIRHDPGRSRTTDVQRLCGDSSKATRVLGWRPKIAWEETLAVVLDDWRARVGAGP